MINRLLRTAFLWAARNPFLGEKLPNLPFMQRAVHKFMPGEEISDALEVAQPLQAAGIGTLYTKLGEAIEDASDAQAVALTDFLLAEPPAPAPKRRGGRRRLALAFAIGLVAGVTGSGAVVWWRRR